MAESSSAIISESSENQQVCDTNTVDVRPGSESAKMSSSHPSTKKRSRSAAATARCEKAVKQPVAYVSTRAGIRTELGAELEARDEYGVWYKAKIIDMRCSETQSVSVLVHFFGWPKRFDRWYAVDSEDLRPTNQDFVEGIIVLARWKFKLFPARIASVNRDGSYDVIFLEDGLRKTLRSRSMQIPSNPADPMSCAAAIEQQMMQLGAVGSDSSSTLALARTESESTIKLDSFSTTPSRSESSTIPRAPSCTDMDEENRISRLPPKRCASSTRMNAMERAAKRCHSEVVSSTPTPIENVSVPSSSGGESGRPKRRCAGLAKTEQPARPATVSSAGKSLPPASTNVADATGKEPGESPKRVSDRLKSRQIVPASTILEMMKKSAPHGVGVFANLSSALPASAPATLQRPQFGMAPSSSLGMDNLPLKVDVTDEYVSAPALAAQSARSAPASSSHWQPTGGNGNCKRGVKAMQAYGSSTVSPAACAQVAEPSAISPVVVTFKTVTTIGDNTKTETTTTVVSSSSRRTRSRHASACVLPAPPISKHSREGRIMSDAPCNPDTISKTTIPGVCVPGSVNEASGYESDSDSRPPVHCLAEPVRVRRSLRETPIPRTSTDAPASDWPAYTDSHSLSLPSTSTSEALKIERAEQTEAASPLFTVPLHHTVSQKQAVLRKSNRVRLSAVVVASAATDKRSTSSLIRRASVENVTNLSMLSDVAALYAQDEAASAIQANSELSNASATEVHPSGVGLSSVAETVAAFVADSLPLGEEMKQKKKRKRHWPVVRDPRAFTCPENCSRRFLQLEDFEAHLKYGHHMPFDEANMLIGKYRDVFEQLAIQLREKPFVDARARTKPLVPPPPPAPTPTVAPQSAEAVEEFKREPVAEEVVQIDKESQHDKRKSIRSSEKRVAQKRKRTDTEKRKNVRRRSEVEKAMQLSTGTGTDPDAPLDATSGGQKRLANDDVVACICAQVKERGLMIQCDLCYSWQHAECYYGRSVTEDSIPVMHCCVACLFPYSVRDSQRFLHEHVAFVRDAHLPPLAPHLHSHSQDQASGTDELNMARLKQVTAQLSELEHIERLLEFERCRIAQLRQVRAGSLQLFSNTSKLQAPSQMDDAGHGQPHDSPAAKRVRLVEVHDSPNADVNSSRAATEAPVVTDVESEASVLESLTVIDRLVEDRLRILQDVARDTERFLMTECECVSITGTSDGCIALPFSLDGMTDTSEEVPATMETDLPSGSSTNSSLRSLTELVADSNRSPPLGLTAMQPTAAPSAKVSTLRGRPALTDARLAKLAQRLRRELGKLKRL